MSQAQKFANKYMHIYMKGKKRRYEGYVKKVKLETQEGDQESDY